LVLHFLYSFFCHNSHLMLFCISRSFEIESMYVVFGCVISYHIDYHIFLCLCCA